MLLCCFILVITILIVILPANLMIIFNKNKNLHGENGLYGN